MGAGYAEAVAVWFWLFCGPALALALLSLCARDRGREEVPHWLARPTDTDNKPRGAASQAAAGSQPAMRGGRPERPPQAKGLPHSTPAASLLPATIIVPVKGEDEGLRENLAALAAQDYPDYELIITVRSAADIPPGVLPSRVKVVLAHGEEVRTGEKIQNLMAGVRAARKVTEVLAFADSDARAGSGWLRALAGPLAGPHVGAVTGYRWYTPGQHGLWPLMRSVWNGAIAGAMGSGSCFFTWGGATAIRKETFFSAGVPEAWKNGISDDYRLAAAVRKARLKIIFAPGAVAVSAGGVGGREFFVWARRQLMITRFYAPRLWWLALVAHFFYSAGMAAVAAACLAGRPAALWVLAGILGPGMLKGFERARRYGGPAVLHGFLTAPAALLWLALLAASAFGRTVRWRGREYVLGRGGAVESGYNDSR